MLCVLDYSHCTAHCPIVLVHLSINSGRFQLVIVRNLYFTSGRVMRRMIGGVKSLQEIALSSRTCENSMCSERLVLGAFTNLHLARRPVVGYLNRSMLASNRLCNTFLQPCPVAATKGRKLGTISVLEPPGAGVWGEDAERKGHHR